MKYKEQVEQWYVKVATYTMDAKDDDDAWKQGETASYADVKPDHVTDLVLTEEIIITNVPIESTGDSSSGWYVRDIGKTVLSNELNRKTNN